MNIYKCLQFCLYIIIYINNGYYNKYRKKTTINDEIIKIIWPLHLIIDY